jgi:hypothetical protein
MPLKQTFKSDEADIALSIQRRTRYIDSQMTGRGDCVIDGTKKEIALVGRGEAGRRRFPAQPDERFVGRDKPNRTAARLAG